MYCMCYVLYVSFELFGLSLVSVVCDVSGAYVLCVMHVLYL